MVDRDTPHEEEIDNWFDEPDTSGAWEERPARLGRSRQSESPTRTDEEDWTSAGTLASTGGQPPILAAVLRHRGRAALAAAILVACLLGGLALAGVFSGNNPQTSPATATTPSAPTTTTTPQVTQPTVAAPSSTLKPGDQGAAVKLLQRALARLGYSSGTIDGQYGPSTTKAVSDFQRANGLTADGILGPKTLQALTRALKAG